MTAPGWTSTERDLMREIYIDVTGMRVVCEEVFGGDWRRLGNLTEVYEQALSKQRERKAAAA